MKAKSHIQYGSMFSDFLDPTLIIPSRMIKTIMKILMRASSVAVGLTIYPPFTAFDNQKSTFHAKALDFSTD